MARANPGSQIDSLLSLSIPRPGLNYPKSGVDPVTWFYRVASGIYSLEREFRSHL